jgi:hypothetical protein
MLEKIAGVLGALVTIRKGRKGLLVASVVQRSRPLACSLKRCPSAVEPCKNVVHNTTSDSKYKLRVELVTCRLNVYISLSETMTAETAGRFMETPTAGNT